MNLPIDVEKMTVAGLLDGEKYGIDVYQREYLWRSKDISNMLEDFENRFSSAWHPDHPSTEVANYPTYFFGPMVMSQANGQQLIVDGQQRITTLTLLLIFLHHLQKDRDEDDTRNISNLIYSEKFGQKSFNLDVEERAVALRALYEGEDIQGNGESESVQNIIARYEDIEETFPRKLRGDALPYFIDWLTEKVLVVVITAFTADEAYSIFETMNDRGVNLTPADMLKGYLVASISRDDAKKAANRLWRDKVFALKQHDDDSAADFLKAWLRAQYARHIRLPGQPDSGSDYRRIGSGFHKWVREHKQHVGLDSPADYRDFIHERFSVYADHYLTMLDASESFIEGLEYIFYNDQTRFTFQYPLMLAAIAPDDDEETARKKMRLVAGFCDIYIARRACNHKRLSHSSIRYSMFQLILKIRQADPQKLVDELSAEVERMDEDFSGFQDFRLHNMSKRYISHMLARMTYYIEQESGLEPSFEEYASSDVGQKYQVEHIWANHPERHEDEFEMPERFRRHRNSIGGLLLLPKEFNQAFGDLPYQEKLDHYFGQNLLARSLHPKCYERNPGFVRFVKESGLPFRPHEQFKREDLDERQHLYRLLAERIWSTERFEQELEG